MSLNRIYDATCQKVMYYEKFVNCGESKKTYFFFSTWTENERILNLTLTYPSVSQTLATHN